MKEAKKPRGTSVLSGFCTLGDPVEKKCGLRDVRLQSRVESGGAPVWGRIFTYILNGDKRIGKNKVSKGSQLQGFAIKTYNPKKKGQDEYRFLVDPEWASIDIWRDDFAIVQQPGTQNWFRLDLPSGAKTFLGEGAYSRSRSFGGPYLSMIDGGKSHRVLVSKKADGSLAARLINSEGHASSVVIDNIAPPEVLAEGRFPVETFYDGIALVNRVDADGRHYNQLFSEDGDKALTPPFAPMLVVRDLHSYPMVVLDEQKGLYWPVISGEDIFAKPEALLGLRPAKAGTDVAELTSLASSKSSANYQLLDCKGGSCAFSKHWVAIWDTPDGLRLAPTLAAGVTNVDNRTEYKSAYIPHMDSILSSQADAEYVSLNPLSKPSPETGAFAAVRSDGRADLLSDGFSALNREPLANAASITNFRTTYYRQKLRERDERDARLRAERAEAARLSRLAQQERQRKRAAEQEAMHSRIRQLQQQGDHFGAWLIARRGNSQAVANWVVGSLRGGYDQIGDNNLQIATHYAVGDDLRLVQNEIAKRRARAAEVYIPRVILGGSPRTPLHPAQRSASQPTNTDQSYREQSYMDYLSGRTSQYRCGASSFCN
ncbi:hypothetical protein QWY75_09135 [Pontixanthobacter aestiaquae]|uniref:Uncharacterized protein n=2 Tax=Pontixanthobacter aestiaquae TaxID=1509367 RepID=A0A844Z763_9SPHN|nr:hypothetical protein [Pontixanthobacter aestiaquae]MDN3646361.1 hypothetical protein [Pontixanthobacter aestiaquae]MXO82650.1 hypothetical protein [Pontixanthobacter aestiaquae]